MSDGSFSSGPIKRRELKSALRQLAAESNSLSWDGENGDPVGSLTLEKAIAFIDALPMGYAEPDPGVDPDGELSFSWIGGRGHRLSLSIGPTGRISYAYRFGPRPKHGTEWFGDAIPDELLERIGGFPINT